MHRDADTHLLQSRLATTTPENAPSNPEESYPRADPSTTHRGGIRRSMSHSDGSSRLGFFFLGSLEVVPCFWSAGLSWPSVIIRGWPVICRILAALVGSWFVGSSPTVVGCVGALELGIPVPFHGLRAPQVRVGKTAQGGQVPDQTLTPSFPILRGWRIRIKASWRHFFLGVVVRLCPVL